jgi:hypothetical protein
MPSITRYAEVGSRQRLRDHGCTVEQQTTLAGTVPDELSRLLEVAPCGFTTSDLKGTIVGTPKHKASPATPSQLRCRNASMLILLSKASGTAANKSSMQSVL